MLWIIGGAEILKSLAAAHPTAFSNAIADQLEHVPWSGLHAFDVIWTLFMFMVGISISISLSRRKQANKDRAAIYWHAIARALILFFLGMIAQGGLLEFNLATLHPFYSVLHGIAAGYLIATIVAMNTGPRGRIVVTGIFLVAYFILLETIPVPGFRRGVLTSTGNAAAYVDHLVMGRFSYGENTWFLSYLGFASSVLLGVIAGDVLLAPRFAMKTKCLILFGFGAGLLALGLLWSIWLPVIKLLWTSSFVLVAGGLSCLMMAAFYLVIDVLGWKRWAFPFQVIGMNALAVYMGTNIVNFRLIGNVFVGHLVPRLGRWGDTLSHVTALTIIWLVLYWMYRTRSFVKL